MIWLIHSVWFTLLQRHFVIEPICLGLFRLSFIFFLTREFSIACPVFWLELLASMLICYITEIYRSLWTARILLRHLFCYVLTFSMMKLVNVFYTLMGTWYMHILLILPDQVTVKNRNFIKYKSIWMFETIIKPKKSDLMRYRIEKAK